MSIQSAAQRLMLVTALSFVSAGGAVAQHHNMPHPPQPPVFIPPTPAPPVPPTLRTPKPPSVPTTTAPDTPETPETPGDTQPPKIDTTKLPKFVRTLGDSADIKAYYRPPVTSSINLSADENWCDWQCEAIKMFPDAEDPTLEYMKLYDEKTRIQRERISYIDSGYAIPEELRIGYWAFDTVKVRKDEFGNDRFLIRVQGFGQEAIFSVAADDIDGGFADNVEKLRSIASYNARNVQEAAEFNRSRAESGNFTEESTKEFFRLAEDYEAQLRAYNGPIAKAEPTTARQTAGDGPVSPITAPVDDGPTGDATPPGGAPGDTTPPGDLPIVPTPEVNDPKLLIDAILADNTDLFDPSMIGGHTEPRTGADVALEELIRTTRDFGNDEVLIDIDVIDNGNLAELANTMAKVSLDVGLAVAGAVNPTVGLTIAFGKNAKETYDYAISKGLSTRQAIFAATAAGAVGGADTYVMGLGIGKVAGWGANAIKGATKGALEHGVGTAGNASGFSLVGNVGKALVDKMAEQNKNPYLYQRPKRTQPTGPGQVTVIMSGGGNWQQNAMQ